MGTLDYMPDIGYNVISHRGKGIKIKGGIKMKLKKIVEQAENFELEFENDSDPKFDEREFTDGAAEHFIVLNPVETDVDVYFAEHQDIKELRDNVYAEKSGSEAELEERIESVNEPADQFNLDKVVGVKRAGDAVEWI